MLARNILTEEETRVDAELGYPRGYAKLCRNAHIYMQGLITPYTEGPPQRFIPYALKPEDIAKVKEFNQLFPVVESEERDPSSARRFADSLWQQLDHLGNAGFDPAMFRIDPYGNVLYKSADPASPLAWEVDHWFPHSRGGKTISSNLRLVQWQVNQRKQNKLEFLVPWWDLQLGVSVNQFLSIFLSKNSDFRQRAFSLLFFAGENEPFTELLVADCHSWPQHFRERKSQIGLAPAAIVRIHKQENDMLMPQNGDLSIYPAWPVASGTPSRRRWTVEEEEALRRAIQRFGPGNWKEIKENEPLFRNKSTVQIKDKYRLVKGDWEQEKENKGAHLPDKELILSTAIQKESRLKKIREDEIRTKAEEISQLNKKLKELQEQNEAERLALEDLESVLIKHRRRAEKQRRWSEAQSSYKICLDNMIRDAMHLSIVYKEQGRLNQIACNALMARLETQKAACDASEMELYKRMKQREDLETLLHPHSEHIRKNIYEDGTASCPGKNIKLKLEETQTCCHQATQCADSVVVAADGVKEESNIMKQREDLETLLHPHSEHIRKNIYENGTASCPRKNIKLKLEETQTCCHQPTQCADSVVVAAYGVKEESNIDGTKESCLAPFQGNEECPKILQGLRLVPDGRQAESKSNMCPVTQEDQCKAEMDILEAEVQPVISTRNLAITKETKEKQRLSETEQSDLDVLFVGYEYEGARARPREDESVGENMTFATPLDLKHSDFEGWSKGDCASRIGEDDELNNKHYKSTEENRDSKPVEDMFGDGLELQGKAEAVIADAIAEEAKEEDEMIKRNGKSNLDKWLQMLLLNPQAKEDSEPENNNLPPIHDNVTATQVCETNYILGGLMRSLSFGGSEEEYVIHQNPCSEKEVADSLDLAEKFDSLQLDCDKDNEEPQTKLDDKPGAGMELPLQGNDKLIIENPGAEIKNEKRARPSEGVMFDGETKVQCEKTKPINFDQLKDVQMVTEMPLKGNPLYTSEIREPEGMIIRSNNRDNSMNFKASESRLKRNDSFGYLSNAYSATSLWGMQCKEGQSKGRDMVFGQVVQREEEGKFKGAKCTEEDGQQGLALLKNGLSASIKICTHMWKKAAKRLEGAAIDQNRSD